MIAVSTVDTVGGLIMFSVAAVYFLGCGIAGFVRARRRPPVAASTAGLQSAFRQARSVETGTLVAADTSDRKDEAGCSSRPLSAATAIEALTFPGPYSRIGNRR